MNLFTTRLQRLAGLREQRPQYAEIYDFYSGLCRFLEARPEQWLDCSVDYADWETRRQAGFPLLTGAALRIDSALCHDFVAALLSRLLELGREGKAELEALAAALAAGRVSLDRLLSACLEKQRAPLEAAAAALQIPAALLEYVSSLALAAGLQQWRQRAPQPLLSGWREGYCPICGGLPAMGELVGEEGQKRLHCSLCATSWEALRLSCSSCGNQESDSLEYFSATGDTGYRVDICRKCCSYLKVVDSRELGAGLPMDVEDLNTMHLDLLAQREGFGRGKRSINQ
jgi:FdhE protein